MALLIVTATGFKSWACATKPRRWASSGSAPPPRFSAFCLRQRSNDRLRVILPRNDDRIDGRCGGMAFHACSQVSLTHSSVSSRFRRMLWAMERQ